MALRKSDLVSTSARNVPSATLGTRIAESGITDLFFSREQYRERLDVFLSRALRSIDVVAVTLQLASNKGDLPSVLASKLREHSDFRIRLSLLDPRSNAVELLAQDLRITGDLLRRDIVAALRSFLDLQEKLPFDSKRRLLLMTHGALPFGSGYLLDATPENGLIHVETRLYGTSRKDSISYQVQGPSEFYSRNYTSWNRLLDESKAVSNDAATDWS